MLRLTHRMQTASEPAVPWKAADAHPFLEYREAYLELSGLSLELRTPDQPVGAWERQSPFCHFAQLSESGLTLCQRCEHVVHAAATKGASTVTCFAGLCETAIPIRSDGGLVGFLRTGRAAVGELSTERFRLACEALDLAKESDYDQARLAYHATSVHDPARYAGYVQMLAVFSEQFGALLGNRCEHRVRQLPGIVERAQQIVHENLGAPLSSSDMARRLNASVTYFSSLFKKSAGLGFTAYVARARCEKAKALLQRSAAPIGEVRRLAGFQSRSQFNRVFHSIFGCSPRMYRAGRRSNLSESKVNTGGGTSAPPRPL